MAERFKIVIVGSGPGGISAAARAAERGESHVLLEAEDHLSNTIYRYQKGLPYIFPKQELPFCENFLHMMFSEPYQDFTAAPSSMKCPAPLEMVLS